MDSVQDYLLADDENNQDPAQAETSASINLPDWLTAKTGPGPVEDYINHPLNFVQSPALAQVIRGLTGMFNKLDYAVIDILLGAFRFFMKKKGGPEVGP